MSEGYNQYRAPTPNREIRRIDPNWEARKISEKFRTLRQKLAAMPLEKLEKNFPLLGPSDFTRLEENKKYLHSPGV
jgi:hypothetical protein